MRSFPCNLAREGNRRRPCRKRGIVCIGLCLAVVGCWWAAAQEELPRTQSKFSMGRIRFTTPNFGWGRYGDYMPPWSHDWPRSEEHLMKIMAEVTKLDVNP